MKKPELLAPAGNMEALYAAIEAGCDAIYLGGTHFGARAFSNNFSDEEMIEAIKYAHIYGVKVYVTVNTMIYESEVKAFMEYVDFLHRNNVDALIIQDIGMIDLIRKTYPNLEIHASTQMHIHNLEGVKLAETLSMKRVVLARETSIESIKNIKKNTNLELEIFIHGALCVCYSGQCLMSSLIGGRSGNRGTCSQSCRMAYDLISDNKKINKDKYLISTKDLNTVEYIGELIDVGVDSLKIEGRMKSKEYVYQVVSLYRMAIDSYIETGKVSIDLNKMKELQTIFNRKYTKGFLFNENNNDFINQYRPNHLGIEIGKVIDYKNNYISIKLTDYLNRLDGIRIISDEDRGLTLQTIFVNHQKVESAKPGDIVSFKIDGKFNKDDIVVKTLDKELMKQIDLKIDKHRRKVKLTGQVECLLNQNIKLTVNDGKNEIILYSDEVISEATNKNVDKNVIYEKLNKLGNTPYAFDHLDIISDDNIFIRLNTLNELKRQMVDLLNQKRLYNTNYQKENYAIDVKEYPENKGFNLLLKRKEDYPFIKNKNIKNIYLSEELYDEIEDTRKVLKLPRVINQYQEYKNELLVGELGSINKYHNINTDFSLNIVNSYSVALLHSLGVKRVTLSYELNDYQIQKLIDNYQKRYHSHPNLELIVSSIPEVMVTKFNLLNYYHLKNTGYLVDNFNNKFKLVNDQEFMTIYFYQKIELDNYQKYFDYGINTLRIHIEDGNDINKI